MSSLPEKIRTLDVSIAGSANGVLQHESQYTFNYLRDDPQQRPAALLMPPTTLHYRETSLFPVMDQNLPEGFLLARLLAEFPKQNISAMHLLALIGSNGIGHLGFHVPDAVTTAAPHVISRKDLLEAPADGPLFEELVRAYLSTGSGVSGIQPKIMVPDERSTWAIPNLIVKAAAPDYPGLSANEFVCLQAAKLAQIDVPDHDLSKTGDLLVLDRFDLTDQTRLGFEDIASLMGLQVRDALSMRKYHGSYEAIAEVLQVLNLDSELPRLFEQVAFSIMVRNGDAHLKNFGVLYTNASDARLAPMFDVVTTAVYRYARFAGGPPMEDHTMALKLFKGKNPRNYPSTQDLVRFGREVCKVPRPSEVLERIAEGMTASMQRAAHDPRIPRELLPRMRECWESGYAYALEAAKLESASPDRRTRGTHRP